MRCFIDYSPFTLLFTGSRGRDPSTCQMVLVPGSSSSFIRWFECEASSTTAAVITIIYPRSSVYAVVYWSEVYRAPFWRASLLCLRPLRGSLLLYALEIKVINAPSQDLLTIKMPHHKIYGCSTFLQKAKNNNQPRRGL